MIPERAELLRAAAVGGALLLALLSKGDVLVLGALLALVAGLAHRPLAAAAAPIALLAAAVRWQSLSLEDIAGAQAVLGAAGAVDPPAGAASAWAAAVALVLVAPRWADAAWSTATALALGASAALVAAGAAPGGAVGLRVVATLVAAAAAAGVGRLRRQVDERRVDVGALVGAVVAMALALAAVRGSGQVFEIRVDAGTVVEGLAVGLAGAAVAVVLRLLPVALGKSAD